MALQPRIRQACILTASLLLIGITNLPSVTADCHYTRFGCGDRAVAPVGGAVFDIMVTHDEAGNYMFFVAGTGVTSSPLPQADSAVIEFGETDYLDPDSGSITLTMDGMNTVSGTLGFTLLQNPSLVEEVPFTITVDGGSEPGDSYSGTLYLARIRFDA